MAELSAELQASRIPRNGPGAGGVPARLLAVMGGSGLGQRVLASARSPAARAVAGALDGLHVNRDNVLHAHNVLKKEAIELSRLMRVHGPDLKVGACGEDPISRPAAGHFNLKLQTFLDQCTSYVQALTAAVDELHDVARVYGFSELHIAASFNDFQQS